LRCVIRCKQGSRRLTRRFELTDSPVHSSQSSSWQQLRDAARRQQGTPVQQLKLQANPPRRQQQRKEKKQEVSRKPRLRQRARQRKPLPRRNKKPPLTGLSPYISFLL
ncbi:hypothetical protein EGW08_021134, partial [Elysia chlorotica]